MILHLGDTQGNDTELFHDFIDEFDDNLEYLKWWDFDPKDLTVQDYNDLLIAKTEDTDVEGLLMAYGSYMVRTDKTLFDLFKEVLDNRA